MAVQAHNGFLPSGRQRRLHGQQPPAGDDEWWEYFPCPFCYIEVEVPFLCDHLQEEHCFDMKNAVCPICADNLGTDTAGHFRDQHSQLLKRRKSSSSSSKAAAADDKETYEEEDDDSCFETTSYIMGKPVDDHSPDPLLFQFICSVAPPPVDSGPGVAEGEDHSPPSLHHQMLEQVEMDDASRQDLEERLQRAEFVTQMLMSTIARD